MLIFRGWGWLGVLLPAFIGMLINESVSAWTGIPHYVESHPWLYVPMMLPGALAVWFLGCWLERQDGVRTVQDVSTGETLKLLRPHDLFWIPLKWWSLIVLAIGVWLSLPHEKVSLVYPRGLWSDFTSRHRETGLKRLAYQGDAVLAIKGKVTALDETDTSAAGIVMYVDDGTGRERKYAADDPRIVLYGADAGLDRSALKALLGQVVTARCREAESFQDGRVLLRLCEFG
jgi:hypothetical protein